MVYVVWLGGVLITSIPDLIQIFNIIVNLEMKLNGKIEYIVC